MKDKVILIFGGSGTFGTAITEQLLNMDIQQIIHFDRDEKNQYLSKQKIGDSRVIRIVGDIRDKEAVDHCISTAAPDIILLASAMKHIDKCEAYPDECKKTNIIGCINVINSAIENNIDKLVFLSTDKATNPTTIYGCSKLFVEMYIQAVESHRTTILTTRYGNVLGSNGSVVDIWKKQYAKGEPLTITNPQMTRFFMPISGEYGATDLVLYAIEHGQDKDLWVYKNKSCTIGELANCISDNQIEVGLRCVEKNDEALLTVNELNHSEEIGYYYRINKNINNDYNYERPLTSDNAERFSFEELKELVDKI